jgi:DNA-directed RNA polymerase specialized sigma24 family protein
VIVDRYKGDPKFFFLKVARYIFWEWKRRPKFVELDEENLVDADPDEIDKEKYATCLEHCLNKLSQDDREFILEFHRHEKRAKIQSHANMAKRLDLSPEGLRTRAHRIRKKLLLCALQYLNGDAS